MATSYPLDDFDTTFEQTYRLELQPVDETPAALRARIVDSLPEGWSEVMPAPGRWFWIVCKEALGERRDARFLLHQIAGRQRVTNIVEYNTEAERELGLDLGEQNRVVQRLRAEVVAPLERAGHVRVHERGPLGDLRDWIGENAVAALARFAFTANRSTGSGHPGDAERWNAFLVAALPVDDGTGFADALQAVLIGNGWAEDPAHALAVQAEQANELLTAYRAARG